MKTTLPSGIEMPPGEYEVTLSLAAKGADAATSTQKVTVLPDPRSLATTQSRLENYRVLMELQEMQDRAVTEVERIAAAQADLATAKKLISQRQAPGEAPDDATKALLKQASDIQKSLLALENRLRVPPETRGYVYDDDKAVSQIGLATYYVGSSNDAPTETALAYIELARQSLNDAADAVDRYMDGELAEFSKSLEEAGIGLFWGTLQPDQG
jgi:hypothetical protein